MKPTQLLGIERAPFVDVEQLIDTSRFDEIDEEISNALVVSSQIRHGTGGIYDSNDESSRQFVFPKEMNKILESLRPSQRETFASLGDPDTGPEASRFIRISAKQRDYLKIVGGVYYSWQRNLTLVETIDWDDLQKKKTVVHPETEALLPKTFDFIRQLPFEETDRIVIFGVDPLCIVPVHRDAPYRPENPAYAEFLNFSPSRFDKRFFVYNNSNGKKHFPQSRAYWFNECDFHGVEAQPHFTYTIRVNGRFTESFRKDIYREIRQRMQRPAEIKPNTEVLI
jgi:Rieske 2Fe-2S family protein